MTQNDKQATKCYFTTNIADELDCDPEGNFDYNGFPDKRCSKFPCEKYLELKNKIDSDRKEAFEKALKNQSQKESV